MVIVVLNSSNIVPQTILYLEHVAATWSGETRILSKHVKEVHHLFDDDMIESCVNDVCLFYLLQPDNGFVRTVSGAIYGRRIVRG